MKCGNCGALLGSRSHICAACGKGTKSGKQGWCIGNAVDRAGNVRGKFFVTAGDDNAQVRYADDGYGLMRAEEDRELESNSARNTTEGMQREGNQRNEAPIAT